MKIRIAIVFLSIATAGCTGAPWVPGDNPVRSDTGGAPIVLSHEGGTESLSLVTERRTTLPTTPN